MIRTLLIAWAPEKVAEEMAQAGYRLAREHAFVPNQYFLIFQSRE